MSLASVTQMSEAISAPALGAGGRRFKSCLPDQHKPLEIAVSGFAIAGDWLRLLARLTSFPPFLLFCDASDDGRA